MRACTRLLKSVAVGAEEREEMKGARMCGDVLASSPKSSLITVEGEAVNYRVWRRRSSCCGGGQRAQVSGSRATVNAPVAKLAEG